MLDDDSPSPGSRGRRAEPRDDPRELICRGIPTECPGRGTGTIALAPPRGERGEPLSDASLLPPLAECARFPSCPRVLGRGAPLGGVGGPNTELPVDPSTVFAVFGRNASFTGGIATSIPSPLSTPTPTLSLPSPPAATPP